ncbi:MAG: hypothetical protein WCT02_04775 [Candidatus Paceibacterota bacterium]
MDISARIRILAGITRGSVYYFEDGDLSSTEPHYFIVLNKNPKTEEVVILACASSQVEKRKQVAQRLGFSAETLVIVLPDEYKEFTKETVIDCNRVFEKSAETLIEKLNQGKLRVCTEQMPEKVVKKMIVGILASNQVSKNIQSMLG